MEEIIMNLKKKQKVYFLFNAEGEFLETRDEISSEDYKDMANIYILFYLPSWVTRIKEINDSKIPYLVFVHPYEEPPSDWTGELDSQVEKISIDEAPAQLRAWMLINN